MKRLKILSKVVNQILLDKSQCVDMLGRATDAMNALTSIPKVFNYPYIHYTYVPASTSKLEIKHSNKKETQPQILIATITSNIFCGVVEILIPWKL